MRGLDRCRSRSTCRGRPRRRSRARSSPPGRQQAAAVERVADRAGAVVAARLPLPVAAPDAYDVSMICSPPPSPPGPRRRACRRGRGPVGVDRRGAVGTCSRGAIAAWSALTNAGPATPWPASWPRACSNATTLAAVAGPNWPSTDVGIPGDRQVALEDRHIVAVQPLAQQPAAELVRRAGPRQRACGLDVRRHRRTRRTPVVVWVAALADAPPANIAVSDECRRACSTGDALEIRGRQVQPLLFLRLRG